MDRRVSLAGTCLHRKGRISRDRVCLLVKVSVVVTKLDEQ